MVSKICRILSKKGEYKHITTPKRQFKVIIKI